MCVFARRRVPCEVSAGRNIETAEPVIIITHPLTSLPNVGVSSSFVLPPPRRLHVLIHVTGGTTDTTPISACSCQL